MNISHSTEEEKEHVLNALVNYNATQVPFTQSGVFEYINFVAKNEQGEIIGGINSMLYCWGILFIDILWVHQEHRSKGIGSKLIDKVICSAKEKDCSLVHLDTFDFQAKDFYLSQGFEVFGTLEDCPTGHNRFYMKKKI